MAKGSMGRPESRGGSGKAFKRGLLEQTEKLILRFKGHTAAGTSKQYAMGVLQFAPEGSKINQPIEMKRQVIRKVDDQGRPREYVNFYADVPEDITVDVAFGKNGETQVEDAVTMKKGPLFLSVNYDKVPEGGLKPGEDNRKLAVFGAMVEKAKPEGITVIRDGKEVDTILYPDRECVFDVTFAKSGAEVEFNGEKHVVSKTKKLTLASPTPPNKADREKFRALGGEVVDLSIRYMHKVGNLQTEARRWDKNASAFVGFSAADAEVFNLHLSDEMTDSDSRIQVSEKLLKTVDAGRTTRANKPIYNAEIQFAIPQREVERIRATDPSHQTPEEEAETPPPPHPTQEKVAPAEVADADDAIEQEEF